MKNKVQEKLSSNIREMKEEAKNVLINMDASSFASLAESIPRRLLVFLLDYVPIDPIFPPISSSLPCSCSAMKNLWNLCYEFICPQMASIPERPIIRHCEKEKVWMCVYFLCDYFYKSPGFPIDPVNPPEDIAKEDLD
ncbi:hypothetical protein Anas_12458 [Armadillidium nasatum]|uniref:Uncharacterized protein n=1 Tax=Armadillidium nasatum TaxID=96803 RepID=A0A5N5STM4_9CRUS|nr:hypothetical protein Anas_12458 [Armadillidium nasatum]